MEEFYHFGIECIAQAIMAGVHSNEDLKLLVQLVGLGQKSESDIEIKVDEVIAANMDKAKEYQSGKTRLLGFFVGQVMKLTGGTASPVVVNEMMKKKLEAI
jgi:aspartyl-tRNA(Asn)/glutamyl-tRNA(Gln) amidotransferase subunit B